MRPEFSAYSFICVRMRKVLNRPVSDSVPSKPGFSSLTRTPWDTLLSRSSLRLIVVTPVSLPGRQWKQNSHVLLLPWSFQPAGQKQATMELPCWKDARQEFQRKGPLLYESARAGNLGSDDYIWIVIKCSREARVAVVRGSLSDSILSPRLSNRAPLSLLNPISHSAPFIGLSN